MAYDYTLTYNLKKDMWNWRGATKDIFMGNTWEKNAKYIEDDEGRVIAQKIASLNKEPAEKILKPYLLKRKADPSSQLNHFIKFAEADFAEKYKPACQILEEITGQPMVADHFTFWITSFPRMPYFYEKREIFVFDSTRDFWGMPIDGFLHEGLHFQFTHYWGNRPEIAKLSNDEFDYLKEGLTMVLDKSLQPILTVPDKGYDNQKEFRAELTKFWQKEHDFDKLVGYGLKIMPKYILQ